MQILQAAATHVSCAYSAVPLRDLHYLNEGDGEKHTYSCLIWNIRDELLSHARATARKRPSTENYSGLHAFCFARNLIGVNGYCGARSINSGNRK